jgi:hypothetical protein
MHARDVFLYGSIWLSLAAWTGAECLRLARPRGAGGAARDLWVLGAALAWLHVGLAFHFRHGWSHASAFAETARQTEELIGWKVGAGVFVNYAFLAVWGIDALWWGLRPLRFAERPPLLDAAVRSFLVFMFVNGAIVFGHGPIRVLGILSVLALAVACYVGRGRRGGGRRTAGHTSAASRARPRS